MYSKNPKNSDAQKICCNRPQIRTKWFYHRLMRPKDSDRMANSVDPEQIVPIRAVLSGTTLFAQAYLSENLEQYILFHHELTLLIFQTDYLPCSQIADLVEQKCRSHQEKDKFRSYIEDMDKIIRLLLKLSGLLARAENTIQGLTESTNEKIKVL